MEATKKMIVSLVLVGLLLWVLVKLCFVLVLSPNRVRSKLEKQGIRGPSPSFIYGNIHDIKKISLRVKSASKDTTTDDPSHYWVNKAIPHIVQWAKEYGTTFMYSNRNMVILCISDPELVKEITLQTTLHLGKPTFRSKDMAALLGHGILTSNGPYWAHQRKIIAPVFYNDQVKDMVTLMGKSVMTMVKSWEIKLKDVENAEIKVDDYVKSLSADMISRACFGSNYLQGEKFFFKFKNLQKLVLKAGGFGIPGLRYVPSKSNRNIWRLEKEIDSMILEIVKSRIEGKYEKDLLQSLLEAAKLQGDKSDRKPDISYNRFIIDNCKSIYFAAYETTPTTLLWCLMLLAENPSWQAHARAEVLDICGNELPDANMILSMKILTMVIQETVRLYPPATYVVREALEDIHLKHIHIPKGVILHIVRLMLNYDPVLWGPDVNKFNPERFAEGVKRACNIPQVYVPFGAGPRICPGQHFAMAQLKVVLSMILSRFSFSLSSVYKHSPIARLGLEPEHGVYLNIRRI